ncbi:MAG: cytochrome c3 family protein [Gemmatimonadota bacterium]
MMDPEAEAGETARGVRSSSGRRGWSFTASAAVFSAVFAFGSVPSITAQEVAGAGGNPCMQCHDDIASQAGIWNGRRFAHTPHVSRANLDCTFCHTPIENHGGMKLQGVGACNDCHHNRTSGASCSRCHEGGVGAPKGIIEHAIGDFDHTHHTAAGLTCTTCHAGSTMSAVKVQCMACHESHHRPDANCLACHKPGPTPEHPNQVHLDGCVACHGDAAAWIRTWTRETCTVCHTGRTSHYPDRPCAVCHLVPEIPTADGA